MPVEPLSAGTHSAPSPSAKIVEYDQYIDTRIGQTRRMVRTVDLAAALVVLAAGVLGFLLAVALVEHWLLPAGFGTLGRSVLFVVLVGGAGYYAYRHVLPLCVRRINPVYAAQTIEQGSPSLKNSLINLLLFRQRRTEIAEAVYETLEEQAAQRLTRVPADTAVDRTQLIRLGYVLVAVVAAAALYKMFSPKDPLITAERVLMPWADVVPASRVQISAVEPGATTIARGEFVDVSAEVHGLSEDDLVLLRFTTADGQAVNKAIPMSSTDDGPRFQCRLPSEAEPGGAVGVTQNLRYRIEAGDARSHEFTITVVPAPAILVRRVDYDYPDYTSFADRHVDDLGDIRAIEGTRVTIHAWANGPIDQAYVDFDADGRRDLKMTASGNNAQASFTLALRPDRMTPLHTSYVLRLTNAEGRSNRDPVKHPIDVLRDHGPEVELLEPVERARDARLDETVTIAVEARDPDFALSAVRLEGEVFGRSVLDEPLLAGEHKGRFTGRFQFTPREHDLRAGDVLQYWVTADDNRTPEPNTAATERKLLRITSPAPARQPPPDRLAQRQPGAGEPGRQPQDQQSQDGSQGQPGGAGAAGRQPPPAGANEQPQPNEGRQGGNRAADDQPRRDDSQGDGQTQNQAEPAEGAGREAEPSGKAREGQEREGQPSAEPGQRDGERNDQREQTGAGAAGGKPSDEGTSPDGTQPDHPRGARPAGDREQVAPDAQPTPISRDGDNDAEAFERIRRHMRRSGELNDEQRPSDRDAQQPFSRDRAPAAAGRPSADDQRQPFSRDAERSANDRSPPKQQPDRNDQRPAEPREPDTGQPAKPDAEKQGEGLGAEKPSGEAQRPTGQPDGSQDQSHAPGGQPTGSQGPSGAGQQPSADQGTPGSPPEMKPVDKWQQRPSTGEPTGGAEPPAPARGKRESDSQGEQGGDRAGGGREGGGQQAPREGTGSAGQNQSADEGAGESSEQGAGENAPSAGTDATAKDRTGQEGSETSGRGTGQRSGQGAEPGGQPGQPEDSSADRHEQPGPSSDNLRAPEEGAPNEGSPSPGRPGEQPGDSAGAPTGGGGRTGTSPGPPPAAGGTAPEADDANLEYARRETDLVLQRLSDQLKRGRVDQQLLDQLGWTEEDLEKFVQRWQERVKAAEADTPAADAVRRELDDALRSLGLRRGPLRQDRLPNDQMRDLREGYRGAVPLEYQERLRAYSEGVSRARQADQ